MRLRAALCLVFLLACADVDRERYVVSDPGVTSFRNVASVPVYLGGCNSFAFQRLGDDLVWSDPIPPLACFWEGFAREVRPGEVVESGFTAPTDPGVWRLHYAVGLGCSAHGTLGDCTGWHAALTRPFQVVASCPELACGPPLGMPNWLCTDGSVGGPTGRCLRDPETLNCGWEVTSCED